MECVILYINAKDQHLQSIANKIQKMLAEENIQLVCTNKKIQTISLDDLKRIVDEAIGKN